MHDRRVFVDQVAGEMEKKEASAISNSSVAEWIRNHGYYAQNAVCVFAIKATRERSRTEGAAKGAWTAAKCSESFRPGREYTTIFNEIARTCINA